MGCDKWFSAGDSTVAELDATIARAQAHDDGSYIEVMISPDESQPLPESIQQQIYQSPLNK